MVKIKDNIYYVGILNPNLRIFDIIMQTEYGTSYNSYLVTGEKTALIETAHNTFWEEYLEKITEVTPVEQIDYIIMNHTEPDHSGSLCKLLEQNPNITVVSSFAGIKNLKSITNMEFKSQTVKTGDSLDLGNGYVFDFIYSPNLHWPDSMFSYLRNQKTVFTCDFLGSHFCEPRIFDDLISYPEKYASSFLNYYTAIFGPFKPFVLDGLKRLRELDFDTVCASHGPVLRQGIQQAMDLYEAWSTPKQKEKTAAVFYVSAYGYTRMMANCLSEELNKCGIPTKAYDIIDHPMAELVEILDESDGVLFGSPTINRAALKPVWDLLSSIDMVSNAGKPCGVFGSYGWSGEACGQLASQINALGLKLAEEPYKVVFKPTEEDFAALRAMAQRFAAAIK